MGHQESYCLGDESYVCEYLSSVHRVCSFNKWESVPIIFFYSEVYIQFCHLNYKQGNDLNTYVLSVFISEKICWNAFE